VERAILCVVSSRILSLSLALFAGAPYASAAPAARAGQDNVLFVVVDDWGTDSSALYNNHPAASLPPTPNLDALAAAGVRFEQAYAPPMCTPSRAAMLTGRHGFRTGIQNLLIPPAGDGLEAAEFTLPEAFAAVPGGNYGLACFGKWHLTTGGPGVEYTPCTIGGWPYFSGFNAATLASYTNWTRQITDGTPAGTSTQNETAYHTSALVDETLAWIGVQEAAQRPWFAWVACAAPHTPLHLPPTALCPSYAALAGTPADIAAQPRAYYEAMLEALDSELGRLLAGVDLGRTNVIVVGDNGTPNTVLQPPFPAARGKGTLYEGGVRVPLLMRGPAVVAPGRVVTEPVHVVDLYATILELAGIAPASVVPATTALDSHSLVPLLQDQPSPRTQVYVDLCELGNPTVVTRVLRDERYKLIDFPAAPDQLYDLANDPYEAVDLLLGTLGPGEQARLDRLRTWLGSQAPDNGTALCSADGATGAQASTCPCGNSGAVGHGCAHSFQPWGVRLSAAGHPAADDVVLAAEYLPATSFTLFLQHAAGGDQVFHDGVLCASGTLVRLRGRAASAGSARFPDPAWDATLTLSQRGAVALGSGATRYYSAWYRNASSSFCPPATANVSNGWQLVW